MLTDTYLFIINMTNVFKNHLIATMLNLLKKRINVVHSQVLN